MRTIDNKFEIGEECYTVCKEITKTKCKCPFCEGKGKIEYNGYEIGCNNCYGSGELNNLKQPVLVVCKVKVRKMIASIWKTHITIKYKVDCIDDIYRDIRSCNEASLFKTLEEAEKYCADVNTQQIKQSFNL